MPQRSSIFTFILICTIFVIVTIPAFSVDSGTYWLLVDATPDARAHEPLNSLTELLTSRGKVPSEQIHHVEGENATTEEIHALLQEIGRQMQAQDTLVFLFHGMVTKPRGMPSMRLLIDGDADGIQDSTLNGWFREHERERTVVIVDGYTQDTNLSAYYGNRETLGTAALNVIQPAETAAHTVLLEKLQDALAADTTDADDNRQLSIVEAYELLRANAEFLDAILAPTGDVEAALLKLSPAIKITTFPDSAQIFINDVEVGRTPKLITENLQQGTSTVSVKKVGYITPPSKTAELQLVLGESVHIGWALDAIAVHGSVKGVAGASADDALVWIDGTAYQQTVAADGMFRFEDWKDSDLLTVGETYSLYAKQGNQNYGSATFTFDGYSDITQSIQLIKRSWFEIAQIEFDRDNHQGAVTAFQNGIERTTNFPQMSEDLTVLLLSSFADALEKQDVQDVTYLVVTAKLAEQLNQPALAKKYWEEIKTKAEKGTPAAELANQRLWQFNRGRYLLNIGLIVLLVVLLASGAWTYYRYRKSKQTAEKK
ncbi:PEGA domain-containing protein [Candidatus Poribacteria bacterium]|nr:PEGA domain-containing protein [Candidatus Poribacteria bacterium]MYK97144.1 PEGA domain-containing protein [Candidatus Poribacteria bacterium]